MMSVRGRIVRTGKSLTVCGVITEHVHSNVFFPQSILDELIIHTT